MYFEYRTTGTHGVFLLNSNGMDVKILNSGPGGTALEYNIIGGILDFFLLGLKGTLVRWQGSTRRWRVCLLKFRIGLLGSTNVGLGTRVSICPGFLFEL